MFLSASVFDPKSGAGKKEGEGESGGILDISPFTIASLKGNFRNRGKNRWQREDSLLKAKTENNKVRDGRDEEKGEKCRRKINVKQKDKEIREIVAAKGHQKAVRGERAKEEERRVEDISDARVMNRKSERRERW